MFWIFILLTCLAFVFIKLGMLSVWVAVFSVGLKLLMVAISVLTAVFIWQKVFSKK